MKAIRRTAALALALMLLTVCWSAAAQAKTLRLNYAKANLQVGKAGVLKAKVNPSGSAVSWSSSDPSVATVNQSGRVTGVSAGTAVITAASGSLSAQCVVTVKPVKITKVALSASKKSVSLSQQTLQLTATVKPSGADVSNLAWKSSNTGVATVDKNGLVTLKKAGTVKIGAVSPSGKKAVCTLKVTASSAAAASATRRGLVIGEGRANAQYKLAELPMAQSEVSQVAQMMRDNGIATSTLVNGTRKQVLSAIQSAFSGATENDVSYLYITCHGGVSGGNYLIFPCGDGYFTAAQLRSALSQVKGKVVLMLGSCQSGSVIGKSTDSGPQQFVQQFVGAQAKSGEFAQGKYLVLCACRSDENGYGVITTAGGSIVESGTFNFFGTAVVEGGQGSADANGNGSITLQELYAYVRDRVSQLHLEWRDRIGLSANDTQTVVVYPSASNFVVFG